MKAVVFDEPGGIEQLKFRDVPEPAVGPHDVLVRVRAVSVNRTLDILVREREGRGWQIPMPHISGADPAGDVVAAGEAVTRFKPGDRVVAVPSITCGECHECRLGHTNSCQRLKLFGVHTQGGYAELAAVPDTNLLPIPSSLEYDGAATIPVSWAPAWHLLVTRGHVQPEDIVLVLAAGSGIGVAGLQIAKLHGARVLAAAGNDDKLEKARGLGADWTVNYAKADLPAEVRRITGGRGADVVFENVGSATFSKSVQCLAVRGRLLTCGTHAGDIAEIDLHYCYLQNFTFHFCKSCTMPEMHQIFTHMAAGQFRPVVHARYPLRDAAAAQTEVLNRKNFGKVVLQP